MISLEARGLLQLFYFVLAVLILGVSAAGMQLAKSRGWMRVVKKPLPIRKPLKDLNRECLSQFHLVVSQPLSPEIEDELGTMEYVNWILDRPGATEAWRGKVTLLVTYYTGKQDQVPHVPEECFSQGAFSPGADDTLEMEMSRLGETVPIRRLSFYPPRQVGSQMYVYYTICVNNDYFAGRNRARFRMGDMRDSHQFYSKVEVSFQNVRDEKLSELDEYARDLLDSTLAELVQSHWPRKGWERGGPPADEKEGIGTWHEN